MISNRSEQRLPLARVPAEKSYSVADASKHALTWCTKNPAWIRICDLGETNQYYVQWDELSATQKRYWGSEEAYNEFSIKRCKIKTGFISGAGEFYTDAINVPLGHNFMMVFRIGVASVKAALASRSV